jgi:transposase
MNRIFCGIDFHKNTSTLCALNSDGSPHEKITTIRTDKLIQYLSNRKDWKFAIEASGGVNPISRQLRELGYDIDIIDANKFEACMGSRKKTDERDARGLAEIIRIGNPPTVHLKSERNQKIKSILVCREEVVNQRVSLGAHIRGTLRECGISFPAGKENFIEEAPEKISEVEDPILRQILELKLSRFSDLLKEEASIEELLRKFIGEDPLVENLQTIPGVGFLTACCLVSVCDDAKRFSGPDQFASYLGLTPRVSASGNKCMMGRITRSGSEITRRYLIHGARAQLRYNAENDPNLLWAHKTVDRIGKNKGTVALAHKIARIAFAMLRDSTVYKGRKKKKQQRQKTLRIA